MLSTAVLQPGTALACLPPKCRQPLSQLLTLGQWSLHTPQKGRSRPQTTAASTSLVEEQVSLGSTSTAPPSTSPSVLEHLQARQPGRLKPDLVDKQGRIMLKNLTKPELVTWLEQQGSQSLHLTVGTTTARTESIIVPIMVSISLHARCHTGAIFVVLAHRGAPPTGKAFVAMDVLQGSLDT